MLGALSRAGYSSPTPIQSGLIPLALDGFDVIGQAKTGTGKTAAFSIPILEQVDTSFKGGPQALILVPTRELAVQVRDEMVKLAHGRRLRVVAVYGGKPLRGQIDKLHARPHVIVGTPGRVLDHMGRGTLVMNDLECVVLDEADRMLDIGFRPDIERILRRCPSERQTLLLSATVPPPIQRLAQKYMHEPQMLDFSPTEVTVETIDQYYFTVPGERKFELLVRLLKRDQPRQAIIFCRTKRGAQKIYERLRKKIPEVDCIHGDLKQTQRDRVLRTFREGTLRYMVATDVVGRGIDVAAISHIINYDIPQFSDDYVHRVGRTGRMGREGVAYTFVAPEEGSELTRVEQRINRMLVRDEMSGMESSSFLPVPEPAADASATPEGDAADGPPDPPGRPKKRYRRAL